MVRHELLRERRCTSQIKYSHGVLADPEPFSRLLPRVGRSERPIQEVGDLLGERGMLNVSTHLYHERAWNLRASSIPVAMTPHTRLPLPTSPPVPTPLGVARRSSIRPAMLHMVPYTPAR
jgi:hypothetical protein